MSGASTICVEKLGHIPPLCRVEGSLGCIAAELVESCMPSLLRAGAVGPRRTRALEQFREAVARFVRELHLLNDAR